MGSYFPNFCFVLMVGLFGVVGLLLVGRDWAQLGLVQFRFQFGLGWGWGWGWAIEIWGDLFYYFFFWLLLGYTRNWPSQLFWAGQFQWINLLVQFSACVLIISILDKLSISLYQCVNIKNILILFFCLILQVKKCLKVRESITVATLVD